MAKELRENTMGNFTVVTKDYIASNGEHFYLVSMDVRSKYLNGKQYGAFNYNDVEENGKIKKCMNGHEAYMHNTIAEVISDIEFRIKIDEKAKAEGVSKMAAMLMIQGGRTKAECVAIAKEFEKISKEIEREYGKK